MMDYKELTKGVLIPALGLGTWEMGGQRSPDTAHDKEDISAIKLAIDLGMTHIDTAENYAAGHSEELVGEAIKPYKRSDLFITTKVWHNHLHYDDLIAAMKASLKRLQTDYVDLYLVHWPNPEVPLKETMNAMEHCARQGYARFIGVSNFPATMIQEAQTYLKDQRLVADQVEYNLIKQDAKKELLPYCRKNDVTLIAYRPLLRGILTKLGNPVLDQITQKYGKTPGQVALNWLIAQDQVVAIPKTSNPKHMTENAGAVGWKLAEEDVERLGEALKDRKEDFT